MHYAGSLTQFINYVTVCFSRKGKKVTPFVLERAKSYFSLGASPEEFVKEYINK